MRGTLSAFMTFAVILFRDIYIHIISVLREVRTEAG